MYFYMCCSWPLPLTVCYALWWALYNHFIRTVTADQLMYIKEDLIIPQVSIECTGCVCECVCMRAYLCT